MWHNRKNIKNMKILWSKIKQENVMTSDKHIEKHSKQNIIQKSVHVFQITFYM